MNKKGKATPEYVLGGYVFQPAPPSAADNVYGRGHSSPCSSGSEDSSDVEEIRDTENSSFLAKLRKRETLSLGTSAVMMEAVIRRQRMMDLLQ